MTDDAQEDAGTITGALDGAFERMMFLTATPFQLGHHELLNVIGRVRGVAWKTLTQCTKEQFEAELKNLGSVLDRAQHRAAELDTAPGSMVSSTVSLSSLGALGRAIATFTSSSVAHSAEWWSWRPWPSDHRNQLALRVAVAIDVPLGSLDRPMASQQLNVPEAAACLVDDASGTSDERPAA